MTRSRSSPCAALAAAGTVAVTVAVFAAACGGGAKGPADTAAAPAPAQPAAAPAQGEPTTAEAVLEASLVAQGGRQRMAKLRAMRQSGTILMPEMGIKGTMTAVGAPPRSTLLTIELAGLGKISQGVSGDVVWEMNPITGARVIGGEERAQLLREATFNADLAWKELYPKAVLAGVVEYAGGPAYKVVLTAADGDEQTRYFAKDTLLPLGVQMIARSQMGKVPVELALSDWREVGGIKYAHMVARKEGPQTLEMRIDKIELDPQLDPQTFALPPEIAALPKPKPAAAAPGK
jgi:hypothetical protein